ncbi:ASB_HP2_G0031470.mRNA.1.CDS.1 [Saccharomyces cerevisiae]|nr:ASB_HP2_G0031470.mRNA.1.CDS.1 [Saccharomyces cerevisiae]CAI6609813.1 ASB_HP2_G0031470.mRNA.1.CDS.1 [Saccharomyces cerevisiae]
MGIIIIGNAIVATLALLNAAPGGYYHIGYTISQRVIFGIRGSVIGIIIRIILSVVWFGSQAYLGSLCLSCVFASWSHHYLNLPDTIPTSVNMTTQQLIGFVVFQIISIPPLFFKPERFNRPLMVTCVLTFFAMMGITIWAVCRNGEAMVL